MGSKFLQDIQATPKALARLGKGTFVSFRVRRPAPSDAKLIYFNRELARRLGYSELLKSRSQREEILKSAFDFDTERGGAGSDSKMVWSDYQSDPLGIAMNGNSGSGRSAYLGAHFNRKGIGRTPHALLPRTDLYGTGRCPLLSAVWELLLANTVSTNLETSGPPIFSAFALGHRFPVPETHDGEMWTAATLERFDDGALDRPTHLMHGKTEMLLPDLREMAERFGVSEGERFMERLLQGAWSAGNISIHGHILDLESSCTVFARVPQYTLQSRYLTNYFGLEWQGQGRVLETLATTPSLKGQGILAEELHTRLKAARQKQIRKRLVDLLGVKAKCLAKIQDKLAPEIAALAESFENLSTKMYCNWQALDSRNPNEVSPHVLDFSALFRRYGYARKYLQSLDSRRKYAFQLLRNPFAAQASGKNPAVPQNVKRSLRKEHLVLNEKQAVGVMRKAFEFIDRLDSFLDKVEGLDNTALCAARAYKLNEDRIYLTASYGHAFVKALVEDYENGNLSQDLFSRQLELLLEGSDRRPKKDSVGRLACDFRLFQGGYVKRLLNEDGSYQILVGFFREKIQPEILRGPWEISVEGVRFPLHHHSRSGLESRWITPRLTGQGVLKVSQFCKLFSHGRWVALTDYAPASPKAPFSLVFE